jgi:hypothetical protein
VGGWMNGAGHTRHRKAERKEGRTQERNMDKCMESGRE